jgi:ribosomal protein L4
MALTRDFRETVQARVRNDPEFRSGLLRDAVDALLAGERQSNRREPLQHHRLLAGE